MFPRNEEEKKSNERKNLFIKQKAVQSVTRDKTIEIRIITNNAI